MGKRGPQQGGGVVRRIESPDEGGFLHLARPSREEMDDCTQTSLQGNQTCVRCVCYERRTCGASVWVFIECCGVIVGRT